MGTQRRRFGGVRELRSGRWQARYKRDGILHTAPHPFDSEADAWAWLATVEADIARGKWRPAGRSTTTLDRYARQWITTHRGLKESTRTLYSADYERHVSPYLGHLRLTELTPSLVRVWLARLAADMREAAEAKRAAMAAKGKSPRSATRQDGRATVHRSFRLLRAVLNAAVADGEVATNPCATVAVGSAGDDDERPVLSVAEVGVLADTVPARYRALVLLLAWGALRLGEACALRRSDVDLTPGAEAVAVRERVYWLDDARRWDFGPPKSRAGRRVVPLPPHVAEALADHLARFTGGAADSLVFTTSSGAVALRVAQLSITRRLDAMGRSDVRVHDLRHSGQVLAALAGATPAELMRRMGHSSSVAAARYSHTTRDHGREVATALSVLADGAAPVVPLASRRRRATG